MRFDSKRLRLFTGVFFVTGAAALAALGSNGKAVTMRTENKGKSIEIELMIKKEFGVQKKGPHEIVVYGLSKNHTKESDPKKTILEYGKQISEIKPLKLTGVSAKNDDEYFSSLDKFQIPLATTGDIGIKTKIYYCSFKDSFCSVDVLYTILPGK